MTPERATRKHETYLIRKNADPDAYRADCRERMRRWRENPDNQAKGRANVKRWRELNRDRHLSYGRDYWKRPYAARALKNSYTVKKYGITLREYEAVYMMLAYRQRGLCAACYDVPQGKEPLHLDHDHATGRLRALLCGDCNRALGILRENPDRIGALALYVEDYC